MMGIGYVRVVVNEGRVDVDMTVRLACRFTSAVRMLMVGIVVVKMLVHEFIVSVDMTVSLAQQKHDAERHEEHGESIVPTQALPQESHGRQRSDERGRRKVGSFASGANRTQREGIEDDADAIAQAA